MPLCVHSCYCTIVVASYDCIYMAATQNYSVLLAACPYWFYALTII